MNIQFKALFESLHELMSRGEFRPHAFHVIVVNLTVDHQKPLLLEVVCQRNQRNFAGIGDGRKHGLSTEASACYHAI